MVWWRAPARYLPVLWDVLRGLVGTLSAGKFDLVKGSHNAGGAGTAALIRRYCRRPNCASPHRPAAGNWFVCFCLAGCPSVYSRVLHCVHLLPLHLLPFYFSSVLHFSLSGSLRTVL